MRRKRSRERAWQLPQGGIKFNESPINGALRELKEETGLTASQVELIAQIPEWIVYELPEEFRSQKVGWGQAQRWFLFLAKPTAQVHADQVEFDAFAWMQSADVLAQAMDFRVPVYSRVFEQFARWLVPPG
jgi:putative (di)nucleoside polyphosphate hydrolase